MGSKLVKFCEVHTESLQTQMHQVEVARTSSIPA
jgi:hypothetical protein